MGRTIFAFIIYLGFLLDCSNRAMADEMNFQVFGISPGMTIDTHVGRLGHPQDKCLFEELELWRCQTALGDVLFVAFDRNTRIIEVVYGDRLTLPGGALAERGQDALEIESRVAQACGLNGQRISLFGTRVAYLIDGFLLQICEEEGSVSGFSLCTERYLIKHMPDLEKEILRR